MELRKYKNLPKFKFGDTPNYPQWHNPITDYYIPELYPTVKLPPVQGVSVLGGPRKPKGIGDMSYIPKIVKENEVPKTYDYGTAISSMIQFGSDLYNQFGYQYTPDDLRMQADRHNESAMGVGYNAENYVNSNDVVREASQEANAGTFKTAATGAMTGAALAGLPGAAIGGAVGLIGGLIGGSSKKKKAEEAAQRALIAQYRNNDFARAGAMTDALQLKENSFAYGKNPTIDTAYGMFRGQPNAKTEKGEWIVNTLTGAAHRVNRGPNDSALSYVQPEDVILSKKTGAADYFERTGDLIGAMSLNKEKRGYLKYKNGKLPKFDLGWIPSSLGALTGAYLYFDANRQKTYKPSTYRSNPYTGIVNKLMSGLGINELPIKQEMLNQEARAARAINMSGGPSSQKMLSRVAQAANTLNAIANMAMKVAEAKNAITAQRANSLAELGQADRASAIQANQYDIDTYMKAQAAKQQGKQMGLHNLLASIYQGYSDWFKKNQFDRSLALYSSTLNDEQMKLYKQMLRMA